MTKKILDKKNKKLAIKYILLSLVSYSFVFVGIIFLVEFSGISETMSFIIIYAINYLFLYIAQNKYLFKTKHDPNKLIRFIIYLVVFYILAIILFNTGTKLGLQYLITTALTIIILFPLRLLILKKVVYKD
jgi:hypothetical protein